MVFACITDVHIFLADSGLGSNTDKITLYLSSVEGVNKSGSELVIYSSIESSKSVLSNTIVINPDTSKYVNP